MDHKTSEVEPEVMTVSEAGRSLNKAAETIRGWADSGKLPAMRTRSGNRIFKREDVERLRLSEAR